MLTVPSLDGLEAARNAIRDELGWQEVEEQLKGQDVDVNRRLMLDAAKKDTGAKVTDLVRQAYCIVVSVSAKNEVQAFKVVVGSDPLFTAIKADAQSRIQETAVSAEALLPGGPYDLWRAGETARRMKDLVEAFAQFSQLPKMLNRKAIQDTLLDGCRDGLFVFRLSRPDHTYRTFWREVPDDIALRDPALEVVLPEAAQLASLSPSLLVPGILPELWQGDELALRDLYAYFSGRVLSLQKDGYEEPLAIPRAGRDVVDAAVLFTVKEKRLWLLAGPGSFFAEDVPAGVLSESATLRRAPQSIAPKEILSNALSTKAGMAFPWYTVREAIDAAIRSRWLVTTEDSGQWPCDYTAAGFARFSLPQEPTSRSAPAPSPTTEVREPVFTPVPTTLVAEADVQDYELQELADQVGNLMKETVGLTVRFHVRMELGPAARVSELTLAKVNGLLEEVSKKLKLQ